MKVYDSIKETTLLRKYWRDTWTLKDDGSVIVRVRRTGKVLRFKDIQHTGQAGK